MTNDFYETEERIEKITKELKRKDKRTIIMVSILSISIVEGYLFYLSIKAGNSMVWLFLAIIVLMGGIIISGIMGYLFYKLPYYIEIEGDEYRQCY